MITFTKNTAAHARANMWPYAVVEETDTYVFKTLPLAIEYLNKKGCGCKWEPFRGGNVPRVEMCGELYTPYIQTNEVQK